MNCCNYKRIHTNYYLHWTETRTCSHRSAHLTLWMADIIIFVCHRRQVRYILYIVVNLLRCLLLFIMYLCCLWMDELRKFPAIIISLMLIPLHLFFSIKQGIVFLICWVYDRYLEMRMILATTRPNFMTYLYSAIIHRKQFR